MKLKPENYSEELLKRYLLGELSVEEQTRIEDSYVLEEEVFDRLLMAENELIDDYVRGELSDRERERFESNYLNSPKRIKRVETARTLIEFVAKNSERTGPEIAQPNRISWWQKAQSFMRASYPLMQLGVAAAMVVLIVGGSITVFRLKTEIENIRAEQASLRQKDAEAQQLIAENQNVNERLGQELERERDMRGMLEQELSKLQEPQQSVAQVNLNPEMGGGVTTSSPGTGEKTLINLRGKDLVRVRLDLSLEDYQAYRVSLVSEIGEEVWKQGNLKPTQTRSGRSIIIRLPSALFTRGDYSLSISGTNDGKEYQFIRRYLLSVVKN